MTSNNQTFKFKRNDTSPSIEYALIPTDIILTGALGVVFNMRRDGILKVNRAAATIVIATVTPTVRYDWDAADTDEEGEFEAEFEVTYADSSIETFPNDGFIKVVIGEDAG